MDRKCRKWRRGKLKLKEYELEKKKWREFIEEKKMKLRGKEEKEFKGLKNEAEIWKVINKKRGKKVKITNSIKDESWEKYFRELLEGEDREEENGGEEPKGEEDKESLGEIEETIKDEENVRKEEVWRALKRMKRRKAPSVDGILMEA